MKKLPLSIALLLLLVASPALAAEGGKNRGGAAREIIRLTGAGFAQEQGQSGDPAPPSSSPAGAAAAPAAAQAPDTFAPASKPENNAAPAGAAAPAPAAGDAAPIAAAAPAAVSALGAQNGTPFGGVYGNQGGLSRTQAQILLTLSIVFGVLGLFLIKQKNLEAVLASLNLLATPRAVKRSA